MKKEKNDSVADLHVHTTYSDGTLSPEKVVQKAIELKLRVIAITDHDCVDGISPSIEAARGRGLEIIPGVEISAAKEDTEIHILGYFIDWQDAFLLETLRKIQDSRAERMRAMVCLLRQQGVNISEDRIFGTGFKGTAGRLHLARVLVEENITKDINEAFDRYIGDGRPCYMEHKHLDYREAIDIVRKAGGVPVLAHPGSMGRDEYIPQYIEAGLRGVEVFHTKHWLAANDRYLKLAKKHNLLITGGSDCHDMGRNGILIGRVRVSGGVVEALREEARKIRRGRQHSSG